MFQKYLAPPGIIPNYAPGLQHPNCEGKRIMSDVVQHLNNDMRENNICCEGCNFNPNCFFLYCQLKKEKGPSKVPLCFLSTKPKHWVFKGPSWKSSNHHHHHYIHYIYLHKYFPPCILWGFSYLCKYITCIPDTIIILRFLYV